MPGESGNKPSLDSRGPAPSDYSELSLLEAHNANKSFWETVEFKKGCAEFAGTTTAGVSGVFAFGIGWAEKRSVIAKAATVGIATGLGGIAKHATKEGMDDCLGLKGKDRSSSNWDYLTGAWDSVAGITGCLAEKTASHYYTGFLGRQSLAKPSGSTYKILKEEFNCWRTGKAPTTIVSDKCALSEGKRILSQDVFPQIAHNVLRGTVGGSIGSLTWSVPHRVYEDAQAIAEDPTKGTCKLVTDVAADTGVGALVGGGSAAVITTLMHGNYLTRYAISKCHGEEGLTRLDVAHIGDAHGQTVGDRNFARAATVISDVRAKSRSLPGYRNDAFADNGDVKNANLAASFTGWGEAEEKIIAAMDPTWRNRGNHDFDIAGGDYDVERHVDQVIRASAESGKKSPITVCNMDYSKLAPEVARKFNAIENEFLLLNLRGGKGENVNAAVIGVVTPEGAVGGIEYKDAVQSLNETYAKVAKQHPDVNIFIIQAHVGDEMAGKIAQECPWVSVIFDGHSHGAHGSPTWIKNGGREIGILRAGAYLSHVGEANLAFNPDGSLNRFHTNSRLHAVTGNVTEDPLIKSITESMISKELNELRNETYNGAMATGKYSNEYSRLGETEICNLYVDAISADKRAVINSIQPGMVRTGLPANEPLNRFNICKSIINAGIRANEAMEQTVCEVTGRQFKEVLEFGASDLAPHEGGILNFIKQNFNRFLTGKSLTIPHDAQGNLVHFNGAYKIDRSLPVGQRCSDVHINEGGTLKPLDLDRTYTWKTRWHYLDKLHKSGVFNPISDAAGMADLSPENYWALRSKNNNETRLELYERLNALAHKQSIPDAVGEYISGKKLDPRIDGKIEGRIKDVTPHPFSIHVGPGPSIPSISINAARDAMSNAAQQ